MAGGAASAARAWQTKPFTGRVVRLNTRGNAMSLSMQLFYPSDDGTTLDHHYFAIKPVNIVGRSFGQHMDETTIARGLACGLNVPPGFHVVATLIFAGKAAIDAAVTAIGPAVADIANFYNLMPQMLLGEVLASDRSN